MTHIQDSPQVGVEDFDVELLSSPGGRAALWCSLFLLATALRAIPLTLSSSPVNDGGLFFQMVEDLLRHDFSLPRVTSYNNLNIPFLYPPLGIYLCAFAARFLSVDIFYLFLILPFLWSVATLAAFIFLCRELLSGENERLYAFAAFGLTFQSYQWSVMGGGIARGAGLFFCLLSLALFLRAVSRQSMTLFAAAGFACALTILSHPLSTMFLGVSLLLFTLSFYKALSSRQIFVFAVMTLLPIQPWIISLLLAGLPAGLLQAVQTSYFVEESALRPFNVLMTGFDGVSFLVSAFALVGILASGAKGEWKLLVWLLIFIIIPRWSSTLSTIPLALLCGIGGHTLARSLSVRVRPPSSRLLKGRFSLELCLFGLMISSALSLSVGKTLELSARTVPDCVRQMASSLRTSTAPDAKVLIAVDEQVHFNPISEWFPSLSQRTSLLTPEGMEWLDKEKFMTTIYLKLEVLDILSNPAHELTQKMRSTLKEADVILASERFLASPAMVPELTRFYDSGIYCSGQRLLMARN